MTGTHRDDLVLTFGRDELVIRRRYEILGIANDILIALWFVAGSVLFFYEGLATLGTWFFLMGSLELLIRPVIRLARAVHLQRIRSDGAVGGTPDFRPSRRRAGSATAFERAKNPPTPRLG
jgi:hypothetical protein